MIITRQYADGTKIEIELSSLELSRAYTEQEHLYDVEDVRQTIDEESENEKYDGVPVSWLEDHIEEIAYIKRKYIDDYNSDWRVAVEDAISDYIADHWSAEGE